jgi:N-acetylglucosaminyldiphosphoundecaprenol N-acetyl-beta-D-mannosaminyltransferase
MTKIDIAGLKIDAISKTELLKEISKRLAENKKTFITTPYSEFLYHILWSPRSLKILNQADFAVADGIGILWAAKFFSLPLTAKNYWLKIAQASWQAAYTLLMILFAPKKIRQVIPEKIVGADLIWDLCALAEKQNLSIYLLGGYGKTPALAAQKLVQKYPKLKVTGCSPKNPDDSSILSDIQITKPDMVFVAFGPIRQEEWIVKHLSQLPAKLLIGLGGTFDYLAGEKALPPKFVRESGLEWLWRLFTQKGRAGRIRNATWRTVKMSLHYKLFSTLPYRQNVVSVILNPQNEIFVGRFNPNHPAKDVFPLSGDKNFAGRWQFPQGGVEAGEELTQAAIRECFEETGMEELIFLKISAQTFCYQWPSDHRLIASPRFRFRGQKQHLVYFKIKDGNKIHLDQNEFVEFKWVKPEDLKNVLHQDKIGLMEIALKDLKELSEKAII